MLDGAQTAGAPCEKTEKYFINEESTAPSNKILKTFDDSNLAYQHTFCLLQYQAVADF